MATTATRLRAVLVALAALVPAAAGAAFGQDAPGPEESAPASDRIEVTLPQSSAGLLGDGRRSGRMIVFLLPADGPHREDRPVDAPFYDAPQPVFSCAVEALEPGKPVTIDGASLCFPAPLGTLRGRWRVQAAFDRATEGRGHLAAGNLLSAEGQLELDPSRADACELLLRERIEEPSRQERPNLRWFELRSATLGRALGREVTMRAGVALPRGWADPDHRRRIFPAVYVVPGFGGRWTAAEPIARMLASPDTGPLMPEAAWIVLDPECPLGHHGFVDSVANGPWGTALVEELIPALEREFRLLPRPQARAITARVAALAGAKAGGLCRAPIGKETDMPAERRGGRTAGAAINPLTGDSVKKSTTSGRGIARQHGSEAGIIKGFGHVVHGRMIVKLRP
jgi:hypothetical protein